jgi:hypothetical protein
MATYRIHRIREAMKEHFRWQAHTGGTAVVKPKDYELDGEVAAATPYSLWNSMKVQGRPLCPGDVLEMLKEDGSLGELQIFKYIGFEPAKWWIAEPKTEHNAKFEGSASQVATTTLDSQAG